MSQLQKLELTEEQISALKLTKRNIKLMQDSMTALSKSWELLETTNAPIGFMDMLYPFPEKFTDIIFQCELWSNDVRNKIYKILND